MTNGLIESIIRNNTHCYFISPHFDDAVFSAGNLMSYLSMNVPVTVINVFTECGDGRNSLSARKYLNQCYATSAEELYRIRNNEDKRALSVMNAEIINLGLVDALWRKFPERNWIRSILGLIRPEFECLYPVYKLHITSGKIHNKDQSKQNIQKKLLNIIGNKNKSIIFCPVGFGNHVDHVCVRDAVSEIFKHNVIYWADIPYYSVSDHRLNFVKSNNLCEFEYITENINKKNLCTLYASQYKQVFPKADILFKNEHYYSENSDTKNYVTDLHNSLTPFLENKWNELWKRSVNRNVFNSSDWFKTVLKQFSYSDYIIITCSINNSLITLIPLVKSRKYGISTYCFPGEHYFDKAPVLGEINSRIFRLITKKLHDINSFYFEETDELLSDIAINADSNIRVFKSSVSPYAQIDANPYKYMKSGNKTDITRILNQSSNKFEIKIVTKFDDSVISLMKDIEAKSRKPSERKTMILDPLMRNIMESLFKMGNSIYTGFLYYNGQPVCYASGYVWDSTFSGICTAYIEKYKHLSPGKILLYLMMTELKKLNVHLLDFSRGKNNYKKEFTPFSNQQYTVIFSSNYFILVYWIIVKYLMNKLEKYPKIYQLIRIIKYTALDLINPGINDKQI